MTKILLWLSILVIPVLQGCSAIAVKSEDSGHTAHLNLMVKEQQKSGTVLVLNGCDGPTKPHYYHWAKQISDFGYNVIIVDSFSSRGYTSLCGKTLTGEYASSAAKDVIAVGKWVKLQPWSNGKVAIVGFSIGGIESLLAVTSTAPDATQVFSGAVAYYPNCKFVKQTAKVLSPLQVHIGLSDEWVPVDKCQELSTAKNFNAAEFYFYKDAHHMFDGYSSGTARCFYGPSCRYERNDQAATAAKQRMQKFLKDHLT